MKYKVALTWIGGIKKLSNTNARNKIHRTIYNTYEMWHNLFTHGDDDCSLFTLLLENVEMRMNPSYTKYNKLLGSLNHLI